VDVYNWAQGARVGDHVRYHFSAEEPLPRHLVWPALRASNEGLVFLAQRRVRDGLAYEATRISVETAELLGLIGRRGLWSRLGEGRLAA
jgi:hypothetical protein